MIEEQPIYYITDDFLIVNDPRHFHVIESNEGWWMRIIACKGGKMTVEIDGRKYEMERNDVLFCTSDQSLSRPMLSPDFKFMMFAVSRRTNVEVFPNSARIWTMFHQLRTNNKLTLSGEDIDDLAIDFKYLTRRLPEQNNSYYDSFIRCLVQAMIYRVSAKIEKVVDEVKTSDFMQSPQTLFESFFNLLNSTYPTPRSVEWYASRLNRTPKYLSSVIKQTSGKKPMEWITEKAVNEISNILKNSQKSVKEICVELNFSSLSFFCRYVHKHLGVSPNEYRGKKFR